MSLVESAIESGRCSLAVSGALLRDEEVMLALKERQALHPMTLAGPSADPVVDVSDQGLARAIGQPNGVIAIVEPGEADEPAMHRLANMVGTAPHKPTIVVVGKRFNLFQMQMMFRGFKIEHRKERGPAFLKALPIPSAEAAAAAPEVPKASERRKAAEPDAPRFAFVGREEELPRLVEALGAGGPVVVSGPRGIGRTWLIEHAIAEAGLQRLPDLSLGRGVGFDTLIARLAEVCRAGGSSRLADALKAPHTPLQLVEAAVASLQEAEGTAGQAMVIFHLQVAAGRTGDFFRKSRLELLVEALLTHAYPLRLVFTSVVQPVFFRERRDEHLRRVELGGVKGRYFHEIFAAYHAPEFPRDKFGPISDKLHGHPLAARTYAVAVRHDPGLIDDERYFRMEGPADAAELEKQVEKRVARLDRPLRGALAMLAHLRIAADGQLLAELGVNRKQRAALIAEGVLDMVGTEQGAKRYRVHGLVQRVLTAREVSDFKVFEDVARALRKHAESAEGVEKLALLQEANRCATQARLFRDLVELEFHDQDAVVDSTIGLLRAKEPRLDLAGQRIAEILRRDPSNSDAHLLKLELLRRQDAKAEAVKEAQEAAIAAAPVPEVFHEAVAHLLARNARGQAIRVLEQAVELLPDQSRLRCRLAALLQRQGRRPEAIEQLEKAMEQDPMLPDAYGLLGTLRRDEGAEALEQAETLLREAVRLAPGDVVQTSRLISLLLDVHKGVPERREAIAEEIKALLDAMLAADKNSWEAHLTYAGALREMNGDLERAAWFLNKARKLAPRRRTLDDRFALEGALLDIARGRLDQAETRLRKLASSDPSNHRIFAGLGRLLERRGQLVAAHAELMRAAERTSPHALDRQVYELDLARLQQAIEAQAAAMAAGTWTPPVAEEAAPGAEAAPDAEATADEPAAPADEPEARPYDDEEGYAATPYDDEGGDEGAEEPPAAGAEEPPAAAEEPPDADADALLAAEQAAVAPTPAAAEESAAGVERSDG